MGLNARIRCGGSEWDCTRANGAISMSGAASKHFVTSYGFFVKPDQTAQFCRQCHGD
jgi:hypothetical protein